VSEKKVFQEQAQASFWGVTVCGMSGWLKPNAHRLWSLVLVTLRTVELGLATQHLLESLAGCWISIFVLRRRLLSAMSLIFQAAAAGDPNVIVRLSPELRAELASFALLGPLCAVNLRAQVDPSVTATDASSSHQAAARAPLPQPIADEAYRHSIQKGAWTRLLTPQSAWLRSHDLLEPLSELPGDDEGYRASPLYCALAALLFGIDSQVTIGCIAKGRSASPRLNQLLARSIPEVLGFQSYPAPLYFPSKLNPSDDPTRGLAVRGPAMELPSWWLRVLEGDPSELDRVMKQSGFGPGDQDFDQDLLYLLGGAEASVLQSANARRVEASKAPFVCASRRRFERERAVFGYQRPELPGAGDRLDPEISELLAEFSARLYLHRGSLPDLSRPGALEVFSERGRGGRELIVCGCPWVLCFRSGHSDERDLDTSELRGKLLRLLKARAFLGFCASPYGASLSRACLPRARSTAEPAGLRHLAPATHGKVIRDNSRAVWIRCLTDACLDLGLTFWVDCPDSSWWWCLPGWSDAMPPSAACCCVIDLAIDKPRGFYAALALAFSSRCGWIGEASKPGLRVPQPRDPRVDLETRPLYSSTSHHLGLRAWTSFLAWCALSLTFDPVDSFVSCPALLAMVLRSYGNFLYRSGGSLQTYRYAILAAQRLTWSIRGHLGPAWELATRWERLQPVQHRTPIPEVIVQALVVLAWAKGYRRWAGVTLLAFYGLARIGEVLKCERSHLLLPSDHLSELQVVFLKLDKAKSSSRGGAQVGDRLYPFGPATYRARWNFLIAAFGLRSSVSDIQWRMRLQHQQTLGHYLQEVAALNSILDA
ncbi:Khsrp, partial [Symbiodinium sp. CCMP2456]